MTSLFLAQALGLYLLVAGLAMIINATGFVRFARDAMSNFGMIMFSGMFALVLGILLILTHNVWVLKWPLIITLLGWLMFIQGIVRLTFPDYVARMASHMAFPKRIRIVGIIVLLLGALLCYLGFFTHPKMVVFYDWSFFNLQ